MSSYCFIYSLLLVKRALEHYRASLLLAYFHLIIVIERVFPKLYKKRGTPLNSQCRSWSFYPSTCYSNYNNKTQSSLVIFMNYDSTLSSCQPTVHLLEWSVESAFTNIYNKYMPPSRAKIKKSTKKHAFESLLSFLSTLGSLEFSLI